MAEKTDLFIKISSILTKKKESKEFRSSNNYFDREFEREFGITFVQLEQAAKYIVMIYLLSLFLIFRTFKLSFTASGLLILLAFYTYNFLTGHYKDQIESKIGRLDSLLYFIKMDIDLVLKLNVSHEDPLLNFIDLIDESYADLVGPMQDLKKRIRKGEDIEETLSRIHFPSKKMHDFFSNLIYYISDSRYLQLNQTDENELAYQTFSKGLETRLSIMFFIGIFFPLGLGFLMVLGQIDILTLILSIPFFSLILSIIKKKLLNDNLILVGSSIHSSNAEIEEYNLILAFYRQLSFNLKIYPPEKAILFTYEAISKNITKNYSDIVAKLNKYSIDYHFFFKMLTNELKSIRSKLLIQNLPVLLDYNSENVSETMLNILKIVEKHLALQNERLTIYNAEKIKASLFSYLLPIILGFLSTVFWFFAKLSIGFQGSNSIFPLFNEISLVQLIMYIISQIIMIIQVNSVFSEIFNRNHRKFLIIISELIYLFTFTITYLISTIISNGINIL